MERCTCGQIEPEYHADENQYEPACWDCYYQWQDSLHKEYIEPTQDELPF